MKEKAKAENRKAEVNSFKKFKSTIMIEGQKDSEAGEVDNAGDRWAEKESWGYRHQIVQEKIEQERESDVTLTNCRERMIAIDK